MLKLCVGRNGYLISTWKKKVASWSVFNFPVWCYRLAEQYTDLRDNTTPYFHTAALRRPRRGSDWCHVGPLNHIVILLPFFVAPDSQDSHPQDTLVIRT